MSQRRFVLIAFTLVLLAAGFPYLSTVGAGDLAGMATATGMKESLALTDDQVTKLEPLLETRFQKVDAALAKVEAAEKPDAMAFIEEYGAAKKEFNTGVTNLLTPDQLKQWEASKAELEKGLAQAGAKKQLTQLQPALHLTDDQVTKLQPAMATAVQKKIDVLQKLADSGRISVRDKLQAKHAMDALNAELEKSMSAVMSPDQVAGYKAAKEKKKP